MNQHTSQSSTAILMLIIYVIICLAIGYLSSRKQSESDFMIGGRRLGVIGFIFSVVASYIGGAAMVAYSAYVYHFGIPAIAVFLGTALGFILFIPFALKLKRTGNTHQFLTLSDWFYHQFGNRAGNLSALILGVVYFGMLLNQFIAGSSLLASISGWSYESALTTSALVIGTYLFAGGFRSVVLTDIFQYLVLLALFIFLAMLVISDKTLIRTELPDLSRIDGTMTAAFLSFGILIVFQSAEYWQRIYAASSERTVRWGLIGSAALVVITGIAVSLIGLEAHFRLPAIEPREAFAGGLQLLLPPHLIGLGLVLVFAAIMSSADTIIFVLASSFTVDYMQRRRTNATRATDARQVTRYTTLFLTVMGVLFALIFRDLVQVIVFITGIGFTLVPAVIGSFIATLHKNSVIISFIAGLIYILLLLITGTLLAEASVASFVVSATVLVASERLIRKRRSNH